MYDYQAGLRIAMQEEPFYGVLMAAMLQADTDNATLLRRAFPAVWDELRARYRAPGGVLESDRGQHGEAE